MAQARWMPSPEDVERWDRRATFRAVRIAKEEYRDLCLVLLGLFEEEPELIREDIPERLRARFDKCAVRMVARASHGLGTE